MAHARFHVSPPHAAIVGQLSPAWRLIGGNNRVLGCSPDAYVDFATSLAAVVRLRERIADAVSVLGVDAWSSGRTWRLEVDGEVVARSARTYLRGRENLYNLEHFRDSVPIAALPAQTGRWACSA